MTTTLDQICRGELALEQPRRGYRFNVDSVILASFVTSGEPPRGRVVDLGAGVGIIGLLLAKRWPASEVLLVELQPELAALAAANAERNGLGSRVTVRQADLRQTAVWASAELALAVSNPPYLEVRAGRQSPREQIARARHELTCTLAELTTACGQGLPRGAQLALIYPARRSEELETALVRDGLGVLRRRLVLPLPEAPAGRILLLAEKGAPSAPSRAGVEQPPLVIETLPGRYSEEMEGILGTVASGSP